MGYTTDFSGIFNLDKPLRPEHLAYLNAFSETRRMKRNAEIAETLPDPIRLSVNLPIGTEGEFYVGSVSESFFGQHKDASIIDYNQPASTQPGLWCHWTPNQDGTSIEWNGAEKFYNYIEWIEYLINKLLVPWGYVLNGEVEWDGEDSSDMGMIIIENNVVNIKIGRNYYE